MEYKEILNYKNKSIEIARQIKINYCNSFGLGIAMSGQRPDITEEYINIGNTYLKNISILDNNISNLENEIIIYKSNSEYTRVAKEFIHNVDDYIHEVLPEIPSNKSDNTLLLSGTFYIYNKGRIVEVEKLVNRFEYSCRLHKNLFAKHNIISISDKNDLSIDDKTNEPKLSVSETALMHYYLKQPITKTNVDKIISEKGYIAANGKPMSNNTLLGYYDKWVKERAFENATDTDAKEKNHLNRLKKIASVLQSGNVQ